MRYTIVFHQYKFMYAANAITTEVQFRYSKKWQKYFQNTKRVADIESIFILDNNWMLVEMYL